MKYINLLFFTLFSFSSFGQNLTGTYPLASTIQPENTFAVANEKLLTGNYEFHLLGLNDSTPDKTLSHPNKKRVWFLATASVVGEVSGMSVLYQTWYKGIPSSSFHFFNDNHEWEQMDKCGHATAAYTIGRLTAAAWEWTGVSHTKAVWLGGLTGLAHQTVVEIFDGFSSAWGFSYGDMMGNTIGAGAFISQELIWKEQRIQVKFSAHRNDYSGYNLNGRADDIFGKNFLERVHKDYNAQTYWLSVNIRSFAKNSGWPAWLNIALGHGADGMFGGVENEWIDANGVYVSRKDIPRFHRWHLAPDIDLTKIKTKSKLLKTVFFVLNTFKFPTPSLELSPNKLKWNWIQF